MTDTEERLEAVKTAPRSVSQVQKYNECPYAFYLERVEKAWQKPAAWFPQGTAVHAAAEHHERSNRTSTVEELSEVYAESYAEEVNGYLADTPNPRYWFRSGPYDGEADIERRFDLGQAQVGRYVEYYDNHPDEVIWRTPGGEPGIELGFTAELGGVAVRGYIDAVIHHPNYGVIVRDNKSGNKPGNGFQLAVYAEGIRQEHEQSVAIGDYWMGRNGKPTVPYHLTGWDYEALSAEFSAIDEGVKAERFDPKPEPNKCGFCQVKTACEFSAG